MNIFPSLNEQMDIIKLDVEEIIPEDKLAKKIEKSIKIIKPLKIKLGCDPSRPDLHIGHAVLLRKLRQFQDLGHTGILLIGDFTAMIGDPTGRNKTRPHITIEETKINANSYIDQASLVLNKNTGKEMYWLIFLGILMSYIANLIRMTIIVIVGHYYGIESLLWTHENIGWIIFTIWMIIFWQIFHP